MKIYDCSLSTKNRNIDTYYGPRVNDIVRYLKQYAGEFGHTFINDWRKADVIFTNDIFPEDYPGKRKVKRMDGVFTRNNLTHRNEQLNAAAQEADHVIFISDFSRKSYFVLYGEELNSHSVIRNEADPTVFYPGLTWSDDEIHVAIAVASHWERPEKRLDDLLSLADMSPQIEFVLLGEYPETARRPANFRIKNYAETPEEIATQLRQADAMISLFYKDAYPKTMVQAVYCGLPVLYTWSGGQHEIPATGVTVTDTVGRDQWFSFYDEVPRLNAYGLRDSWLEFGFEYPQLKREAMAFRGRDHFRSMLKEYFKILAG
jgi:glycosyltransferase involved in cell wall biosynthesis